MPAPIVPATTTAPIDDYAKQVDVVNATKQSLTYTVGGRISIAPEFDPKNGAYIATTVTNKGTQTISNISATDATGIINALKAIHGL